MQDALKQTQGFKNNLPQSRRGYAKNRSVPSGEVVCVVAVESETTRRELFVLP